MNGIGLKFMDEELRIFEKFFPGLHSAYSKLKFEEKEKPNENIFELYKKANGPKLLVRKEFGGSGASILEAISVHRVLGVLSPSLALGVTMHNFTVAFLDKMSEKEEYRSFGRRFLCQLASNNHMLASGFAEGRPGVSIMDSSIRALETKTGYVLSGVKRPCTLSKSMDYLTAGVKIINASGEDVGRGVAVISSSANGLSVKPYWRALSFGAAESDEVCLANVTINKESLLCIDESLGIDPSEGEGWLWFELLTSASYVGIVSSLLVELYKKERCYVVDRTNVAIDIETAVSALRGIAHEISARNMDWESLAASMLLVRYGIQKIVNNVKNLAAELLGGVHFMSNPGLEYLLGTLTAFHYHPPSRLSASQLLDDYFQGKALVLG